MKNHFPILDPLRFAAALGVAVFHLTFWSWAGSATGTAPGFEHYVAAGLQFQSAAPFTWFGWVGVEIFFVISGFVIANSARNASPSAFLLGRALRLYPAVWVCATATFIVLLFFAPGSAAKFVGPYLKAMLLIPKGLNGRARLHLLDAGGGNGLLRSGVLHAADEDNHAAAPGLGPHLLERSLQRLFAAAAVGRDPVRNPLLRRPDVPGAVRGIPVEPWLLLCAGHLAVHVREQETDGP